MLFYRLSLKYPTYYCKQDNDMVYLKSVRTNRGVFEEGFLYVLEENSIITDTEKIFNTAFLILGEPQPSQIPANTAYLSSSVEVSELINTVSEILLSLQEWDCRMKDACLEQWKLIDFFALAREMLDYSFAIVDKDMQNAAQSPDYLSKFKYFKADPDKVADAETVEFFLDDEFRRRLDGMDVFVFPEGPCDDKFLCRNIIESGKNMARFQAILDHQDISPGELQLFRHIAEYAEKLYLDMIGKSFVSRKYEKLHQLIFRLLFEREHISRSNISKILALNNWERDDEYSISVLRFIDKANLPIRTRYLTRKLEETVGASCAVSESEEIVWIVNHTSCPDFSFADGADTIRDLMCKAGTSDRFSDFFEISSYYRQATSALEIGEQKSGHFWYYNFDDYKLDYLISRTTSEFYPWQVVHRGFIRLHEYDACSEMNYVESLCSYLRNQFNASAAASELFVHRSTFLRRLERIQEISGIDLSDQNDVLHVLISMKLMEYY